MLHYAAICCLQWLETYQLVQKVITDGTFLSDNVVNYASMQSDDFDPFPSGVIRNNLNL